MIPVGLTPWHGLRHQDTTLHADIARLRKKKKRKKKRKKGTRQIMHRLNTWHFLACLAGEGDKLASCTHEADFHCTTYEIYIKPTIVFFFFFRISDNNLKDAHLLVPTVLLSTPILYLWVQCTSVFHFTSVRPMVTAKKSLSPKI